MSIDPRKPVPPRRLLPDFARAVAPDDGAQERLDELNRRRATLTPQVQRLQRQDQADAHRAATLGWQFTPQAPALAAELDAVIAEAAALDAQLRDGRTAVQRELLNNTDIDRAVAHLDQEQADAEQMHARAVEDLRTARQRLGETHAARTYLRGWTLARVPAEVPAAPWKPGTHTALLDGVPWRPDVGASLPGSRAVDSLRDEPQRVREALADAEQKRLDARAQRDADKARARREPDADAWTESVAPIDARRAGVSI
jgi:hypothetical protein